MARDARGRRGVEFAVHCFFSEIIGELGAVAVNGLRRGQCMIPSRLVAWGHGLILLLATPPPMSSVVGAGRRWH